MELLTEIGSYGRLTEIYLIFLRSEILGSRIHQLRLDPGLDPGPDPGPSTDPSLVLRPTSKNLISQIYWFIGRFSCIK